MAILLRFFLLKGPELVVCVSLGGYFDTTSISRDYHLIGFLLLEFKHELKSRIGCILRHRNLVLVCSDVV